MAPRRVIVDLRVRSLNIEGAAGEVHAAHTAERLRTNTFGNHDRAFGPERYRSVSMGSPMAPMTRTHISSRDTFCIIFIDIHMTMYIMYS